jgi:hypothetical protein
LTKYPLGLRPSPQYSWVFQPITIETQTGREVQSSQLIPGLRTGIPAIAFEGDELPEAAPEVLDTPVYHHYHKREQRNDDTGDCKAILEDGPP